MIPDLDALPFPAHDLFKIDRYTNLQPLTDGLDPQCAQLHDPDQSRLSVQMHLLLQARHRRHVARALGRKCRLPSGSGWCNGLGATEIGVTDDIWNLKLPRAKELCRRLIEEGLEPPSPGSRCMA
jgi:anaerobic magnesium-protoporphyrin IX monomethyl ester cyclase